MATVVLWIESIDSKPNSNSFEYYGAQHLRLLYCEQVLYFHTQILLYYNRICIPILRYFMYSRI